MDDAEWLYTTYTQVVGKVGGHPQWHQLSDIERADWTKLADKLVQEGWGG